MASEKLLPFLLTLTDVMLKVMCLLSSKSFGSKKIRREVSCPKLRDHILINAGDLRIDLKEIVGRIDRTTSCFRNSMNGYLRQHNFIYCWISVERHRY